MEYLIGSSLAVAVCLFALFAGFDRDRSFYPTMVLIVSTYYVLFAVMGGSASTVVAESLAAAVFFASAVAGLRRSPWFGVVGLIGHGLFDCVHHLVICNSGLPRYWPGFCLTYDIVAGAFLAGLIVRRSRRGNHLQVCSPSSQEGAQ